MNIAFSKTTLLQNANIQQVNVSRIFFRKKRLAGIVSSIISCNFVENVVMQNKKLKIYLDTSAIGGYYDEEFESDTKPLFERILQGEFEILYSIVTEDELINAPAQVRELLDSIPDNYKTKVELTEESILLADAYIIEDVVGKTSRKDCFHIALATIHHADVLVSWNFKHIVNVMKIRGYNSVNIKYGYATIDIRSPKEI